MEELSKKKIDTERMVSSYQKETQAIARDLEDPSKKITQEQATHNPSPTRSFKKAAIRTYRDYAASSLSKGGGSLTRMIVAEREKKREQKRHSASNPTNMAVGMLSALMVILGFAVVGGAFFLVNSQLTNNPHTILTPEHLILYDYRSEVYVSNPTRNNIMRKIEEELVDTSIEVGSLKYLYFATDDQFGGKTLMSTQALLEGIRAKVPSSLVRSLNENFMYGIFSTVENAPFLIFKTDNYSSAYAGMLEWERTLGLDLATMLHREDFDYSRSTFVDVIYYNNDTRAILDSEGEAVLGYSFTSEDTVVIFSNKRALQEVVSRDRKNTTQR